MKIADSNFDFLKADKLRKEDQDDLLYLSNGQRFWGDIDLDQIEKKCCAYTPVPGGVGPMTINTLLMQTVEACEKSIQK